jgi:hypothetical protein
MTDLQTINNELLEIIGSLGAADVQSVDSDDQIIMGHVRDAYARAIKLRRQVFADQRAAALSSLAELDAETM